MVKNSPEGLNSEFELVKQKIRKLEDKSIETIKSEEQKEEKWIEP